jgi:hypothetical protein
MRPARRRVRFVYTSREAETQTDPEYGSTAIADRLRTRDIESLLLSPGDFSGTLRRHAIPRGFYYLALQNPRFDPLTQPPGLLDGEITAFTIRFFPQNFTVSAASLASPVTFPYAPNVAYVFQCLETGILSPEFVTLIRGWGPVPFNHGMLFCECEDHRHSPPRFFRLRMTIGPELVQNACEGVDGDPLEAEAQMLLLVRPSICIDPSPEVARVQSFIDFRKKLWCNSAPRLTAEHSVPTPPISKTHKFAVMRDRPAVGAVDIPESVRAFLGGS